MNRFDLLYLAAMPFFLTVAGYKRIRHGKYRSSLPGMFGRNLPSPPLPPHQERVWLHSVSVGETVAAAAVYRLLREHHPEWEFLSTTTTETGQEQARRSLAEAKYHDFAPVDLSWKVERFLNAYRPSMYLFFETEIWPNILKGCARRGMPIFLVNGKLSERSAKSYARLSRVLRPALNGVSAFLMQTEGDAERLRAVVGDGAAIHVTGNVKFDNLPKPLSKDERRALRREWGVEEDAFVVLAGSTHPREEKLVYEAFRELKSSVPDVRLIIAPRHPERFAGVEDELGSLGAEVHRATRGASANPADVILLDRMGVLARSFGAADVALVGGAWNPIGGHNLLEPAAHGVPVVHGPAMHSQKEIMRIMRSHKASVSAEEQELGSVLMSLAKDREGRAALGAKGKAAAAANVGAAERSVRLISEVMTQVGKNVG